MPATTDKQRKFMNVVAAAQAGDKNVTGAAKKAAKTMSKKSVQDFAHTKGKLPKKATKKKTMKESVEETHMMGHDHPGCEDNVGAIYVVLKPTPGTSPADLVHQTHAFGMHQHDPMNIHGIYGDEGEANMVAEAACTEMYKHLQEIEKKKQDVTERIEKTIGMLQKEVNRCMEEGMDERAQGLLEKIKQLRSKGSMVEASKKPIEEVDPKKKIEEGWLDRTTARVRGTGSQIGTSIANLKSYVKGNRKSVQTKYDDPRFQKSMAMLKQKAETLANELIDVEEDLRKLFPEETLDKVPEFKPYFDSYLKLIDDTYEASQNIANDRLPKQSKQATQSLSSTGEESDQSFQQRDAANKAARQAQGVSPSRKPTEEPQEKPAAPQDKKPEASKSDAAILMGKDKKSYTIDKETGKVRVTLNGKRTRLAPIEYKGKKYVPLIRDKDGELKVVALQGGVPMIIGKPGKKPTQKPKPVPQQYLKEIAPIVNI